jgi:hypothetical protein
MSLNRCRDCQHRDICKYKEEYDKVVSEIRVKVPEPFTLTLNCAHYSSTSVYLGVHGDYNDAITNQTNSMEPLLPAGAKTFVY